MLDPITTEGNDHPLVVLVADDEPLILAAVERILTMRGHRVLKASSATQALEILRSHRVDVALVDHRMPGNGMNVIRHLCDDRNFDGMLVLMSGAPTADPLMERRPDIVRLRKPFRPMELVPLLENGTRH